MTAPTPPLACTVRGCGRPLLRVGATWRCDAGHSFDVARRGYVNLLQPTDRRSLDAGDSREAVEARSRLVAAGIGQANTTALLDLAAHTLVAASPVVVDLGSGSGETLAGLAARIAMIGIGIDLSTAAAEHAARHAPTLTWVVANADRRLPLQDASVDLVLSQQGRRNPDECARVLKPGGHLLVSVPGPDDLLEIRTAVQGEAVERNRMDAVIDEHACHFTPVARQASGARYSLDRAALLDLLTGTYRGARFSQRDRLEGLDRLDVTVSAELCLLRRT